MEGGGKLLRRELRTGPGQKSIRTWKNHELPIFLLFFSRFKHFGGFRYVSSVKVYFFSAEKTKKTTCWSQTTYFQYEKLGEEIVQEFVGATAESEYTGDAATRCVNRIVVSNRKDGTGK